MRWIRNYHLAMSEWDKSLIINAFEIPANQNIECTIFVITNVYNIGINNLNIKLIIQ